MIQKLFLPEHIHSYYPLPKKILGVTIGQYTVQATYITRVGRAVTCTSSTEERIAQTTDETYEERVVDILKKLSITYPYDELRTSLVGNYIIFKELTLPFSDREQIDLVIRYEIEPFLPFPLADAVVDFIITNHDTEKKISTVMVAAVQKKYITEHVALFTQAGIDSATITIDIFDLYGLYRFVQSEPIAPTTALISFDLQTTQIAYLSEQRLRHIRILPEGLISLAKKLSQKTGTSQTQAYEDMIRFGMINTENAHYTDAITTIMRDLIASITFTLNVFGQQDASRQDMTIVVSGQGTIMPDFIETCRSMSGQRCIPFSSLVMEDRITFTKGVPLTNVMIGSLATALPSSVAENVNFAKEAFLSHTRKLLLIQLGTAIVLGLATLGALFFNTYRQSSALYKTKQSLNREVLTYLSDQNLIEGQTSLQDALDTATEKINQEEEIWFAFSTQTRFSMLKHLQSLTAAIDRESTQLNLERLEITEKTISVKGSVPNYEKLKVLERELVKSDLFTAVPTLQELKFDETLTLKHKNGTS